MNVLGLIDLWKQSINVQFHQYIKQNISGKENKINHISHFSSNHLNDNIQKIVEQSPCKR